MTPMAQHHRPPRLGFGERLQRWKEQWQLRLPERQWDVRERVRRVRVATCVVLGTSARAGKQNRALHLLGSARLRGSEERSRANEQLRAELVEVWRRRLWATAFNYERIDAVFAEVIAFERLSGVVRVRFERLGSCVVSRL